MTMNLIDSLCDRLVCAFSAAKSRIASRTLRRHTAEHRYGGDKIQSLEVMVVESKGEAAHPP